jgi:ketosteroid isomerase-like protein
VIGCARWSTGWCAVLRDAFQRRVDAWLAADLDAYMACWAEDMVITLPSGEIRGVDRYRRLVAAGFEWAEPVSFAVHHLAFEGDHVALADWTIRARRREDNSLIEWRGLSVCEFRADGKIAWWREHHLAPPAPVAS